jgi:hypothetical protein
VRIAEVSSGLSASTPIESTFNKSNPPKAVENIETVMFHQAKNFTISGGSFNVNTGSTAENEDRKPPQNPQISCEYLVFLPTQGIYYPPSEKSLYFWWQFQR